VLKNNYGLEAGAFRFSGQSSFSISNSLFEGNTAFISRSIGLILEVAASQFVKTRFVSNSFFNLTESSKGTKGIEILATNPTVKFTDCEFTDNQGYQ
jgi:hypothetical protein